MLAPGAKLCESQCTASSSKVTYSMLHVISASAVVRLKQPHAGFVALWQLSFMLFAWHAENCDMMLPKSTLIKRLTCVSRFSSSSTYSKWAIANALILSYQQNQSKCIQECVEGMQGLVRNGVLRLSQRDRGLNLISIGCGSTKAYNRDADMVHPEFGMEYRLGLWSLMKVYHRVSKGQKKPVKPTLLSLHQTLLLPQHLECCVKSVTPQYKEAS